MKRSDKIFYGILSFLPLVLLFGFLISIIGPLQSLMDAAAWNSGSPRNILPYMPELFGTAFTLLILMTITTVVLLIMFISHVVKNNSISGSEQLIWIVLFVMFGTISFPAYFLMRIWHRPADHLQAGTESRN